jgi:hypothetical protein
VELAHSIGIAYSDLSTTLPKAHSERAKAADAEPGLKTVLELCETHGGPFLHVALTKV